MRNLCLLVIIIIGLCSCKTSLPVTDGKVEGKIHVGPGTEDAVIDTFNGRERLLVSCNQRRKGLPYFGEIVAYSPATGKIDTLKRENEPKEVHFNPHGIDLVRDEAGKPMLFVVNHYTAPGAKVKENSIIVYEVKDHSLAYKTRYLDTTGVMISPNDVSGLPDGSFYVTNDSKRRKMGFGWLMEKLFKVRTSTIAYCDKAGKWSVASNRKLAYANGIHAESDHVIASATQKGDLAWYKRDKVTGALTFEKDLAHINGMDNITMVNNHQLLVAVHPNSFAFLKHAKDSSKHSPGIIDLVDVQNGNVVAVYANDGTEISANSVALYFHGKIYIGQVFEDFLLVTSSTGLK